MSIPDHLAGPWFAFLLDENGFGYRSIDEAVADADTEGFQVVIVRRSAIPVPVDGDPDVVRLRGSTTPGDLIWICEYELPLTSDDLLVGAGAHFERALAMAQGLNAAAQLYQAVS
jgi:hypothetical protein